MSQEQLLKAAVPTLAAEVGAAGANLPNLTGLAAAAIAKEQEELVKTLTTEVGAILRAADSKIEGYVNQRTALQKSLDKLNADLDAVVLKKAFAAATNNFFPIRKEIGIPTGKDILARFPDIDKVPEGWTAPVQAAAPVAQAAAQ